MFRLDCVRVTVAEFRTEPLPCARPVISAFLLFAPDDAFGFALGKAQRHRALVCVTDAALGVTPALGDRRRFGLSSANAVPFRVEFNGALLIFDRRFRFAVTIESWPAATHRHQAKAECAHCLGRTPAPAAVDLQEVSDLIAAHALSHRATSPEHHEALASLSRRSFPFPPGRRSPPYRLARSRPLQFRARPPARREWRAQFWLR
jgi:hypothetical protein